MLGTSIHNITAIRMGNIYPLDADADSYARKIFIYSADIPMDAFQITLFGTHQELSNVREAKSEVSAEYSLYPGVQDG